MGRIPPRVKDGMAVAPEAQKIAHRGAGVLSKAILPLGVPYSAGPEDLLAIANGGRNRIQTLEKEPFVVMPRCSGFGRPKTHLLFDNASVCQPRRLVNRKAPQDALESFHPIISPLDENVGLTGL